MRPFLPVAGRDLAVAALTLALLALDARLRVAGDGSALAVVVGASAGTLLTLSAFLVHEWGHLVAAVASGALVSRPPGLSPYLFFYDTASSTRAQFLWMSAGGYVATALALPVIVAWADLGAVSGVVALALTIVGVGITLALEVPTTVRVWRGAPLPAGGVYTG